MLTPLAALAPLATMPGRGAKTVLEWSREPGRHIPLWMGIVNVTPDSFSDGGRFESWPAVDAHVDALVAAGASFIDVGAESTRPGATPLDTDQEWQRLERVLSSVDREARIVAAAPTVQPRHLSSGRPRVARWR